MSMHEEIKNELVNHIIPFWESLKDDENGGYYGLLDYNLKLDKKAEKGCILNSRILWFFSSCYIQLKDKNILSYANHAFEFLVNCCFDNKNGGVFWSLNYDGTVCDDTKHTYNQAFAIYALSAYYRASGNGTALDLAKDIFNCIETNCKDEGGYLEAFTREFKTASNEKLSENGVIAKRTMNTLLHVFEGYAGLYEATRDSQVEKCLRDMLDIFCDKIYNPKLHRQEVFFDLEYNSLIDLHSYGHDIETSWLIDWGCSLLNDEKLMKKISAITLDLTENVYKKAYHNKSLYNECENGIDDKKRVWWVQAEAVLGFVNAYKKNPENKKYLETAENIWSYIRDNVVDNRDGSEWYSEVSDNGKPNEKKEIVEPWKCPYHSGRMCLKLMRKI